MSPFRKGVLLVLLAAGAFAAGCGFPPSRPEFLEKMSKENRKLAHSTVAFRTAVKPITAGQPAEAAKVHSAYNDMEKALKEVKADMKGQQLPPSSASAENLLNTYNNYLDGQQDILDNYLSKIVQEVESNDALPDKQAAVNDLLGKIKAKEDETWKPLLDAQKTYASEHNLQVMDLASYISNQKAGK